MKPIHVCALSAASLLATAGLACAQSALVWENESAASATDIAEDACNALGLSVTLIDGNLQADFRTQLAAGGWDVVVVNNPLNLFDADTITAMRDWVNGGGRLHCSYWNGDDLLSGDIFGFSGAIDYFAPKGKVDIGDSSWGGTGNLFPDAADPYYADNGDDLTLNTGYRSGLSSTGGAIATSVGGRTIYNAWDYRSMTNQARTQAGIRAQIRYLLGIGSGVLVYTEARDDAQWDVDAADAAFGTARYRLIDSDTAALNAAVASGRYDCIVIHQPANSFAAGFEGIVDAAVDDGAKVHFSYWNLDASPSLQTTFDVASTVDFFAPKPVHNNTGHPSWSVATSPVTVAGDEWNDNGDDMTASPGAQVVSRFTTVFGPGATIIGGRGQRTLINGFEYESMTATEVADLLEAQMVWLCNPGCIQFEDRAAAEAITNQYAGVRFSTTGGGPASISDFVSFFGTLSVVNATAGGTSGDRELTLSMRFNPSIDSIEFDFNSAGTPAPGFEFPIRFYRGAALVRTEGLASTGNDWARNLRFDGLSGVTRIEIDSFADTWIYSIDNICFDTACRADIDGDGVLTIFDFLAFQNAFDSGDLLADFDGDGVLTLFDFLAFQNEFDAGCP
ncbi:MAG: hypothetical protein NCW75_14510 [Phycisphaera sp.]|nr:MAG: hypothetical protein NCW75_14510 [Phycisphaera sp.]